MKQPDWQTLATFGHHLIRVDDKGPRGIVNVPKHPTVRLAYCQDTEIAQFKQLLLAAGIAILAEEHAAREGFTSFVLDSTDDTLLARAMLTLASTTNEG